MALTDFVLPTLEVPLPGGSTFAVRGISSQDVAVLISQHASAMETFFARFQSGAAQTQSDLETGMSLIIEAPALMAKVIALAADEPSMESVVARLPVGVQLDALQKIAKISFEASGGPGEFVDAVVRLVKGTTALIR